MYVCGRADPEFIKLQQVSENCFATLNEGSRVCDASSGLIHEVGQARTCQVEF